MLGPYYISNDGCETVAEVLYKNKTLITNRLLECIDVSFNNGLNEMTAFTIKNPESEHMEFVFTLYKECWQEVLENCMDHFLEIEDYENCSYTRDLQDRISTDFTGHPDVD